MIESYLTQSRRVTKAGIPHNPAVLGVFAPSCEAESGSITHGQTTDMMTTVSGEGTLSFYWKVSSESSYDWLEFYIDGVRQDRISGEVDWQQKTYNLTGSGNRTLVWRYVKDGSVSEGDDCGWVDWLQWSGDGPIEDSPDWQKIEYVYDPAGRRIEKRVDGVTELKFVYDGPHIIAEYDGQDNLLRKYVHGPSIDEPICLIEASGDYAGTHYYHYDALGSVIALTDADGDVVQLYEYSVYGQAAASDPNHPNRFMFTGREFDKDTGLYYYRARYYHPEVGRFLQVDLVGYSDGMNLYRYCRNNPIRLLDPFGLTATGWPAVCPIYDPCCLLSDVNDVNDYNDPCLVPVPITPPITPAPPTPEPPVIEPVPPEDDSCMKDLCDWVCGMAAGDPRWIRQMSREQFQTLQKLIKMAKGGDALEPPTRWGRICKYLAQLVHSTGDGPKPPDVKPPKAPGRGPRVGPGGVIIIGLPNLQIIFESMCGQCRSQQTRIEM
jgi:RHS repeat-associated protein